MLSTALIDLEMYGADARRRCFALMPSAIEGAMITVSYTHAKVSFLAEPRSMTNDDLTSPFPPDALTGKEARSRREHHLDIAINWAPRRPEGVSSITIACPMPKHWFLGDNMYEE